MDELPGLLVLSDGKVFQGKSIGAEGISVGELVFNTSMTGYQEILTDPSYARQIVSLTYPHIGNTGVNRIDCESDKVWASGLIVYDAPRKHSNWRADKSLREFLREQNIVAIEGVDTRSLTKCIREKGSMSACLMAGKVDVDEGMSLVRNFSGIVHQDLASIVSTKHPYAWMEGTWKWGEGYRKFKEKELSYHVVVLDFGAKRSLLRSLADRSCRLTVLPCNVPFKEILALKPDGIFLSNGPGDPLACEMAIKNIRLLLKENIPIFGVCLGYQLLALACGAKRIKMKFGHHGANHPVEDLSTGKVSISSQNHGFSIDLKTLPESLKPTHVSLFDQTLQGVKHRTSPAFGFQGHPEASPGPHDLSDLFDLFVDSLAKYKEKLCQKEAI